MRIAVFGASGFVGTALVERLLAEQRCEVLACINRVGSAWRLSRSRIPWRSVDILAPEQLTSALGGVTHVVNCTRGGSDVMLAGLKNLLAASKAAQVKRFVHLSSISVYTPPADARNLREDTPTNPEPGSYGWEKLKQDDMVEAAHAGGLDCVMLCPPNISGVYSGFCYNVLSDLRAGTLALVDGGSRPNSTVDVDNLVHAITLSLKVDKGDGKRIFVTDGGSPTWKDMADGLTELAERIEPFASVTAEEITPPPVAKPPMPSLWRSLKHVASSDVREALRRDPRWAWIDAQIRGLVAKSGAKIEDRLRLSIEGPQKVTRIREGSPYSSRYMAVQLRGAWHEIGRARAVLGYDPPQNFMQSMNRYRDWYKLMYGFGEAYWPLARTIETFRAD